MNRKVWLLVGVIALSGGALPRSLWAACGDGTIDSGEQCDDSNTTGGDGCSSSCQVEQQCYDVGNKFSFFVWSDSYDTSGESGVNLIFTDAVNRTKYPSRVVPRMWFATGDVPYMPAVYSSHDQLNAALSAGNYPFSCSASNQQFPYYVALGNHDVDGYTSTTPGTQYAYWKNTVGAKVDNTLVGIKNVHWGPQAADSHDGRTTYSFDYKNAHFVVVNQYYADPAYPTSNPTACIRPALMTWIDQDLAATTKPVKFVFGHEPAWSWCSDVGGYGGGSCPVGGPDNQNPPQRPRPYSTTGDWLEPYGRHWGDSLEDPACPSGSRAAFWSMLANRGVIAHLVGHTHTYSGRLVQGNGTRRNDVPAYSKTGQTFNFSEGVWEIDAGGTHNSAGASYVLATVNDNNSVTFEAFDSLGGESLKRIETWTVNAPPPANYLYVDNTIGPASCTTYSVQNRNCTGGTARAWKDMNAASAAANPGETVVVRGGTFTTQFAPQKSGLAGNPITFQAYTGETVTITGNLDPALLLSNRQYLVIDGFQVNTVDSWFLGTTNMSHVILRNNRFSGPVGTFTAGSLRDSSYNQILNNTFIDSNGDSLTLFHSDHNLIQGNTFTNAAHTLWALKCSNYNVVRGNVMSNAQQKASEVFDCDGSQSEMPTPLFDATKHNVIEDNAYTLTAPEDGGGPYAHIQYAGQQGIIRGNVFFGSGGGAVDLSQYSTEADHTTHNRVYHNTFHANVGGGVVTGNANVSPSGYTDNIAKNNIFYKNTAMNVGWLGELGGSQLTHRIPGGFVADNNSVFGTGPGDAAVIYINTRISLAAAQSQSPSLYMRNIEVDPSFVNATAHNYHLNSNSPVIDQGAFLTRAVSAGNGTSLRVADAGYFMDGFGISGLAGDLIQLDGDTQRVQVVGVDYVNNILTLSQALTWTANQGVALAYNDTAPDLGALETGAAIIPPPPPLLPAPTLRLPTYLPVNSRITVDYPQGYNLAGFVWGFFLATAPVNSVQSSLTSAAKSMKLSPSGKLVPARATSAVFPTTSNTADLASQQLTTGTYVVGVVAVDNQSNVSPPAIGNVTLVMGSLDNVRVYPNPWRSDRHSGQAFITFDGLTVNTHIKIFTVSGHWVKDLTASSTSTTWDLTTNSGDKAASGIYLYLITADDGQKKTGKIVVIK